MNNSGSIALLEKALYLIFEEPQDERRLGELEVLWDAMKSGRIRVGYSVNGRSELSWWKNK